MVLLLWMMFRGLVVHGQKFSRKYVKTDRYASKHVETPSFRTGMINETDFPPTQTLGTSAQRSKHIEEPPPSFRSVNESA